MAVDLATTDSAAPVRVLVTGSRAWTDPAVVTNALTALLASAVASGRTLTVVHGAAPRGVDAHAEAWARWHQRSGSVAIERHRATAHGEWPGCGPRRSAFMVGLGADLCLAFIAPCTAADCHRPGSHGSHGATHCAALAESAGIPTRRRYTS